MPPPPSTAQCAAARAHRELPAALALDPKPGALRVFAMQFKQEVRHVVSYASFRTKIECMIRDYVVPHLAPGEPNLVVFNEDTGLATIATGSRGAAARTIADNPTFHPSCESQGVPCGVAAALAALDGGYVRQLAYYRSRYPALSALSGVFVAATDTFARGFMQVFSDMARRYGVYIVGSNTQAPFRESRDPADIDALADPDQPRPASVFVATAGSAYDAAFVWAPSDVREGGPPMLRNVVTTNLKVPLTPLEQELQFAPGPSTGPAAVANLRPYAIPGSAARIGIATSLPAFVYGQPAAGVDPCSDASSYYMRCLNELGANVVVQDEANPGRWAGNGSSFWQPLEWMGSAYRATADASVGFGYAVNPMMVGNLADLAFDGQSSITARGLRGPACNYVGDSALVPADGDPAAAAPYAGPKPEFLALAPWVTGDASRADLRRTGARLAPGSRDALENDYVETALIGDLTFPGDAARSGCLGPTRASVARQARLHLTVSPRRTAAGRLTRFRFRVTARVDGRLVAVSAATVAFAGRRMRTGRGGRASLRARLWRAGRTVAVVRRRGYISASATVRVRSARPRPSFTG